MGIPTGGFAGVKPASFEALVGTFNAVISDGTIKESREDTVQKWAEDNPEEYERLNGEHPGYVAWTFDVTDEGYENRKAWYNTPLTEKGKPILMGFLLGVGYTEEELFDESFNLIIEEVEGRTCKIVCKEDRKNPGQTKILKIMPSDDSGLLP